MSSGNFGIHGPGERPKLPGERSGIDAGGVTVDAEGYVYAATRIGVRVCDPSGRAAEVISPPGESGLADVFTMATASFAGL